MGFPTGTVSNRPVRRPTAFRQALFHPFNFAVAAPPRPGGNVPHRFGLSGPPVKGDTRRETSVAFPPAPGRYAGRRRRHATPSCHTLSSGTEPMRLLRLSKRRMGVPPIGRAFPAHLASDSRATTVAGSRSTPSRAPRQGAWVFTARCRCHGDGVLEGS